jgi:hypothetical protein
MRACAAVLGLLLLAGLAGRAESGAIWPVQGWEELDPEQRRRALENYQRYQKLPKDRQREIDQSWQRWRGMDSREKKRVRRNYESYRQLDREQRKDFGERYQQWRRGGPDDR